MVAINQFGIAPSEFWKLSPQEFWWIAEAKCPEAFQPSQRDRLLNLLDKGFERG